jgi:hypothetical protein
LTETEPNESSISFKSEPQESNDTNDISSDTLYFDNFEITHPRDILDLETPIKPSKQNVYENEINFHHSIYQFNGHNSGNNYFEGQEQSADSTDEYIVTSLDDFQRVIKDNEQLSYNVDNWADYQNDDMILSANTADLILQENNETVPNSECLRFSQVSNNC